MIINIDTKIENHERQIVEKNRFIVYDFVYWCDEHTSNVTRHNEKLCYYSKHFLNIITR